MTLAEDRYLGLLCGLACGVSSESASEPASIDWDVFLKQAGQHRVVPLLGHLLRSRVPTAIPDAERRSLLRSADVMAIQSLIQLELLSSLLSALDTANIPVIPLKGLCLAVRHYPSLSSRYSGDIDLLVEEKHLRQAEEVLLRVGCVPAPEIDAPDDDTRRKWFAHHLSFRAKSGIGIELHFSLNPNPAFLPMDFEKWISTQSKVQLANMSAPVLPDDVQFVYLCTHGARHYWKRLQWLCDIVMMIHDATIEEQERWLKTATDFGLFHCVHTAVLLAHEFVGLDIPAEIGRRRVGLRVRFLVAEGRRAIRGELGPNPEKSTRRPSLRLRLYRLCLTPSFEYILGELTRGVLAVFFNQPDRKHSGHHR